MVFLIRLFSVIALLAFSSATWAQDQRQEQFKAWEKTAIEAKQAVEDRYAPNHVLERLRAQLAEQRAKAFALSEAGSVDVRTLNAQLEALGPEPKDKKPEPAEIAGRRAQLKEQIAVANAPVLAAQEAFKRADTLIAELDKKIRARATRKLLSRSPSPVVPTRWLPAISEFTDYLGRVRREIAHQLNDSDQTVQPRERLPFVILILLAGILVLALGRGLIKKRLEPAVARARGGRGANWLSACRSTAWFIMPALGMGLLVFGVYMTALTPGSADTFLKVLPFVAFIIAVSIWLGHSLFAPDMPGQRLIKVSDKAAVSGSRLSQALGATVALEFALEAVERDAVLSSGSVSVFVTPIILLGSYLLWRLSQVLLSAKHDDRAGSSAAARTERVHTHLLTLLSRLMQGLAVAAPILAIVGYISLAREAFIPITLSIGLMGIGLLLFRAIIKVLTAIIGAPEGREEEAEEQTDPLWPIAIAIMIGAGLVPLLALIWGARPADLGELWLVLTDGVKFGQARISLAVVVTAIVVFASGVLLTRWLQSLLRSTVFPRTKIDSGGRNAILAGINYVGLTLAAIVAISSAGLDLSNLAYIVGALSVGLGFGLQNVVSNFVSGLILLIERPIKEGDWIEVSGHSGYVRKIAVRSTHIETFDRHDIFVPNADLISGSVKNMTMSSIVGRIILPVGVAYGSDLEKAREILLKAANDHATVLETPEPKVYFRGLGDSAIDLELRCYLSNVNDTVSATSDLYFEIYNALRTAGIEIPFPQRDIGLRDLQPLLDALASGSTSGKARAQKTS